MDLIVRISSILFELSSRDYRAEETANRLPQYLQAKLPPFNIGLTCINDGDSAVVSREKTHCGTP